MYTIRTQTYPMIQRKITGKNRLGAHRQDIGTGIDKARGLTNSIIENWVQSVMAFYFFMIADEL